MGAAVVVTLVVVGFGFVAALLAVTVLCERLVDGPVPIAAPTPLPVAADAPADPLTA